jgi:CRISPR-associated protein Cmr1
VKNTIKATFSIVTPMFLGDAEQKAVDIRPPSIKGALRFWWRALNWGRLAHECLNDEAAALRKLHAEEARLFGISASNDQGGQGVFLLRIDSNKMQTRELPSGQGSALGYLKGQGLNTRQAISENQKFSVQLFFRPLVSPIDKKSIADALYAFGLLGALGSRARHGMGSVALTQWNDD